MTSCPPPLLVPKVNHTYGSPLDTHTTPGGGHGAATFGERWGQLSVGREPPGASEERGPLPAGWGAPPAQRPRQPAPQQQLQQAILRVPSDQGDKSSSEGGSSGAKSVSTEATARAGGSVSEDLGVELAAAFGPPTGLEDAVSREVAARMAGIEDKFDAMFGRLKGLLDANSSSSTEEKTVAVSESASGAVSESATGEGSVSEEEGSAAL